MDSEFLQKNINLSEINAVERRLSNEHLDN